MWSMLIMIRNKADAETKDAKCDMKYTTQNEKAKGKDMSVTAPPRPNCDPIDPSTRPHQRDTATQEKKNSDATKRRPNDGGYQCNETTGDGRDAKKNQQERLYSLMGQLSQQQPQQVEMRVQMQ